MQISLRNKGLYRMKMGRKVMPQQYLQKSKFLNRIDEAFDFMCIHIYRELLFHLEGLRILKEVWEKIDFFFGKYDELRHHILQNYLIALQPNNFKTIQQFFSKYKSLVLQCKQCGIERKDEQLVLSILSKLGSEFSVFVIYIPLRKSIHPKLKNSFSRCICRVIDPRESETDSDGGAQFLH